MNNVIPIRKISKRDKLSGKINEALYTFHTLTNLPFNIIENVYRTFYEEKQIQNFRKYLYNYIKKEDLHPNHRVDLIRDIKDTPSLDMNIFHNEYKSTFYSNTGAFLTHYYGMQKLYRDRSFIRRVK